MELNSEAPGAPIFSGYAHCSRDPNHQPFTPQQKFIDYKLTFGGFSLADPMRQS
jgi:hypothetical protein